MRPCPGHKAAIAVWHTVAEAVLRQVLQLVSWKINISKTFNVNMPAFKCLETCSYSRLIWQQLPFEHGPGPSTLSLKSQCLIWDIFRLVSELRKVLYFMSGPNSGSHSLGRLRTTGFSQHSPITCVSHTSGCNSQENLDTQHKHPGACYCPSAREHCDHSPGSNSFSGSSELAQMILPDVKEGRITSAQLTLKSWLGIFRSTVRNPMGWAMDPVYPLNSKWS